MKLENVDMVSTHKSTSQRWRLMFLLLSITTLQAKVVLPTLTILSSAVPSSRDPPSFSSILHSSPTSPSSSTFLSNGAGAIPPDILGTRSKRNIDLVSKSNNERKIEVNSDSNERTVERANVKKDANPFVSIAAVATTGASKNGASKLNATHRRQKQQLPSTTAYAIFIYSLAMISGFAEICSLKSFGCFTNMVTGSTVRIVSGIVEGQFSTLGVPMCVTIGYISGIMLGRIVKHYIDTMKGIHDNVVLVPSHRFQQVVSKSSHSRLYLRNIILRMQIAASRNPSSMLLRSATPLILILFTTPEIVRMVLKRTAQDSVFRVPTPFIVLCQAIGYGFIAQAISEVQTIPTNVYVLTGHYVSISKSFINHCLKSPINTGTAQTTLSKIKRILSFVPDQQQHQSMAILLFFALGAAIGIFIHKYCTFLLPIQHSLIGTLFIATFVWYSNQLNDMK
jgi:uncharacterized membrane protein YoaK (UPF0700 family)